MAETSMGQVQGKYVHPHPHSQLKKLGIPILIPSQCRDSLLKQGWVQGNTYEGRFICHLKAYLTQS